MNISRRHEAGFTLLEILVAVALTAVVMGMGFSAMISAQQIARQQQEQSAAARDGWTLVYKICKELREAVPPAQLGDGAEWRGTGGAEKNLLEAVPFVDWPAASSDEMKNCKPNQAPVFHDTIRFCTLRAASPNSPPAPGVIEYSLKGADANGQVVDDLKKAVSFVIVRRSAPMGVSLDEVKGTTIRPSDASSLGFVSLGFQYLDAKGQWQKEWTDSKAMPQAVSVSVSTLVRPSRLIKVPVVNHYSTLVYLPTDSRIPQ